MTLPQLPASIDPAVLSFLLRLLCGVTAIWLAAAIAVLLLRRSSAALRHRLWALSILTGLLLPTLIATLPERRVGSITLPAPATPADTRAGRPALADASLRVRTADAPTPVRAAPDREPSAPNPQPAPARPVVIARPVDTTDLTPTPPHPATPTPAFPWRSTLPFAALLPTLYLLVRLARSHLDAAALLRRATPTDDARLTHLACRFHLGRSPRLLESTRITSPLCLGLRRPAILLPTAARFWPPAQFDAVLTHELAHVARRDVLWQALARLACAVYWFHPLAWVAAWRMRVERELACDDWVLRTGESPTTYARHLLDVATALTTARPHPAQLTAVAMASRTNFEHRIRAILDPARRRLPVTPRAALALALVALALLAPLSTLSPLAPSKPAQAPKPDPDFPALRVIDFDVVDTRTNRPIDQVKLTARVTNQRRSWETDDNGHARIEADADSKSLTVWADKDGYVPTTVTWEPLRSGEPIPDQFLLPLERATTIGGVVTDVTGKPIVGADVRLAIYRKGESSVPGPVPLGVRAALYDVRARTDLEGRWRYERAPAEVESVNVRLEHPDFLADENFGQRKAPPQDKLRDQTAVMVMTKGVPVAGRVVDPAGKPVAGAQLALGMNQYGWRAPTARSGPDGRFTMPNCRPGQHATLICTAAGWAPHMSQFQLDKPVADLEVKLEPGRLLKLRVVDPKGQPIPSATVSSTFWRGMDVLKWRATTAADGRVAWTEAPPDEVQLGAHAKGYIAVYNKRFQPAAADAEHVITLAPTLKITGTVVDDQTGKPVSKYRGIRGWTSDHSGSEAPIWSRNEDGVRQSADGAFEYTETSDRDGYALRIEAPGYLPAESRVIKPGEQDVKLEFRLKKGKDLAATLRSADGKPLAGADVLVVSESSQINIRNGKPGPGTYTLQTKADAAGRFRFEPQTGKYTVLVLHDLGFAELTPDAFTSDNPVLTIPPWATIRGTARVGSKPAVARKIVAMAHRPGRASHTCSALADDNGNFALDRVPPGQLSVGIEVVLHENPQGSTITWTQRQQVVAESGKTLDLKIGGAGRRVVGRLVAPADLAAKADWHLADARLTAEPKIKRRFPPDWNNLTPEARDKLTQDWLKTPEGQAAQKERQNPRDYPAPVANDGLFRADDVEPGTYVLNARLETPVAMGGSRFGGQLLASALHEFTVPEIPTGRTDEPLDLGAIQLAPERRQSPAPATPTTKPTAPASKPAAAAPAGIQPTAPVLPVLASQAPAEPTAPIPDLPPLKLLHLDVVDSLTNRPLPAVKLSASVDRQQRVWSTDDTGHAPLDLPGDLKALTVRADKDGYIPTKVSWAPVKTHEPLPENYLLKLEPGSTIGGRVLDESGKPVPNVPLDLYLFRKGESEASNGYPTGEQVVLFDLKARTDAQGRWQYPLAPRDLVRPMFRFNHPDFLIDEWFVPAPATASPEKLRDGSAVLTITRGVRIAGRVLDHQGNPVPGARVALGKTRYGRKPPPETRTATDGHFDLPHCRPGQRADLLVTAPGHAPTLKQFQLDKDVTDLEVRTTPARPLALRVVDPAGKPLANARLAATLWRGTELLDFSARTDDEGRLSWPDAPADPVHYDVQLRGYIAQTNKPLTPADAEHVITLLPELTLRGTVVDDETGKPVENFRVFRGATWSNRTTPAWIRNAREIKTQPGQFEIKETEEQPFYAVAVEALGYRPAESPLVKPGERVVPLEFRLKKGPDLAATILAADGKPLANADVLLATESGQILINNGAVDNVSTQCQRTRTDAAGHFRVPAQAGPLRVLVVHPDAFVILTPEELTTDPTITAPAWARIEGTARIGAKPATGVEVEAFFDTSSQPREIFSSVLPRATATVDAQGHYVLDRVYRGKSNLGLVPKRPGPLDSYMSGGAFRRTVHVDAGQTAHFDLGGTGRAVTGRLVPPAAIADRVDRYYANATLTMKAPRDDEYYFHSPIARDGSFRFDDVPPGDYQFAATYLTPPRNPGYSAGPPLAARQVNLTVPTTPDPRTDTPLDLGNLQLTPTP